MSVALPVARRRSGAGVPRGALAMGTAMLYLSILVLLPLAAVVARSLDGGIDAFWDAVTSRQAVSALRFTLFISLAAAAVNALFGTLIAWVLVRDQFRGKSAINALIDLPFALPTIVAGLTLLALYGPRSPIGIDVAFTRTAIALSLLFVTLPFVVRTVQPVLLELDRDAEQAARSLGASEATVFRRIVLPTILPGILSGVALAFARAMGEIGAVVLISGNLPFKTELASVFIFNRVQSGDPAGAAAVATVLLVVSFAILLLIGGLRRLATRHERA
jgi:sulfate/thiosulfate transport system permease protein